MPRGLVVDRRHAGIENIIYGDRDGHWSILITDPGVGTPSAIVVTDAGGTRCSLVRLGTAAETIRLALSDRSQYQLAHDIGTDQSTVSHLATRKRRTPPHGCLSRLVAIAAAALWVP